VTLAVIDRLFLVKDLSRAPPRGSLGATVLDSITLTAEEWKELAPPKAAPGREWIVPEGIARQFYPILSTSDSTFRNVHEVTSVRLAGRVEKIDGAIAYLTYEGNIAATHVATKSEGREGKQCSSSATLLGGIGTCDVKSRELLSLTLVYDGRFRNYAPYDNPPSRFGAVIEWTREPAKR
jgi:hypothetical protein